MNRRVLEGWMDSAKNLKNFKRLDHQGQLWILKSVPMTYAMLLPTGPSAKEHTHGCRCQRIDRRAFPDVRGPTYGADQEASPAGYPGHRLVHTADRGRRIPRYGALWQEQARLAPNLPHLAAWDSLARYLWPGLCPSQSSAFSGVLSVLDPGC